MKILLIDDHSLFLEGMQMILMRLGADTEITPVSRSTDALNIIDRGTPFDLILVDIHMPQLDGIGLLQSLQARNNLTPVVVVSATQNEHEIQHALQQGAFGFIPKSLQSADLIAAIQHVLQGNIFIPDSMQHLLNTSKTQESISTRQKEVLLLIEQGLPNKQIASTLNISESTVKNHVYALFQYFNTNNRTTCINLARERGLLPTNNSKY